MSDLDRITSFDEVTRILKQAEKTNAEIYCQVDDLQASIEIRAVAGSRIVLGLLKPPGAKAAPLLAPVFGDKLVTGKKVEVVMSLVDGQYAVREVIQDVTMTTFTVSAGAMMRLQRRKDFRVSVRAHQVRCELFEIVPPGRALSEPDPKVEFKVIDRLELLDLSAGGMRLVWPPARGPAPQIGSTMRGRLKLPSGSVPIVQALFVKDHGPMPVTDPSPGVGLSFQFQNLGQETARAVLFACLFIHRDQYGGAAGG